MPASHTSTQGGKAKQTRRRHRLSCVECTKRRQKCDRQIPCGLCTSRGIASLCRWEPIVVRPTPQRPPALSDTAAADTIQALSARVAKLEQYLSQSQDPDDQNSNDADPDGLPFHSPEQVASSSSSSSSSDQDMSTLTSTSGGPRALYDFNIQLAAVALAQLSLAPREEYVGSGTVLCALNRLGEPENYRYPYSRSSAMTSASLSQSVGPNPFLTPIQDLVARLPSRTRTMELLDTFFSDRNWQFGLHETWFRNACTKMWRHLDRRCPGDACLAPGVCTACLEQINPHWLSLLFSVLALTPRADRAAFFAHALSARRLIEDILLAAPACSASENAVHGAVLSCIGTALLAVYHADSGRVSEAWKLAGNAMRSAQAMGLHRDPGWRKWESMGKEESELRLMAWWSVWVVDRIYSFILGRPMMAPKGSFDVTLLPGPLHSDGSPNTNASFLRAFIRLYEIIGECAEKCLGIYCPSYATVLECDRRFQDWITHLPPHLQWRKFQDTALGPYDSLSPIERNAAFQRHRLAAGFLDGLMNIHRPYLMHPPPILPPPSGFGHMQITLNPSRERCIELAIELVRVLCKAQEDTAAWPTAPTLLFQYTYFVFDGAVTLAGALSQTPPHPRARECLDLMDRARRMLEACVRSAVGAPDGEGEIATRALTVLAALGKAGGWERRELDAPESATQAASPPGQPQDARMADCAPHSFFLPASFVNGVASASPSQGPCSSIPFLSGYYSGNGFQGQQFQSAYSSLSPIPFEGQSMVLSSMGAGMGGQKVGSPGGLMMPFDMLQNSGEFEVEWTRIAGMDNWQNPGAAFDAPQSGAAPI